MPRMMSNRLPPSSRDTQKDEHQGRTPAAARVTLSMPSTTPSKHARIRFKVEGSIVIIKIILKNTNFRPLSGNKKDAVLIALLSKVRLW